MSYVVRHCFIRENDLITKKTPCKSFYMGDTDHLLPLVNEQRKALRFSTIYEALRAIEQYNEGVLLFGFPKPVPFIVLKLVPKK